MGAETLVQLVSSLALPFDDRLHIAGEVLHLVLREGEAEIPGELRDRVANGAKALAGVDLGIVGCSESECLVDRFPRIEVPEHIATEWRLGSYGIQGGSMGKL